MEIIEQIQQFIPIAQIISVMFAAVSVSIAAIGLFRTATINQRQINTRVFLDCVKRYENILDSFPEEARKLRFDPINLPPEDSKTTQALLRYLNLCSEEFYLKRQGYFSEQIWDIWAELLKKTIKSALFKREWENLKEEFAFDEKFTNFINQTLHEPVQ